MNFIDFIAAALKNTSGVPVSRPEDPYVGTLPRKCKSCLNRQEDKPPDSLAAKGVKPSQFCKAFERPCFVATEYCSELRKKPIKFETTQKKK